MHTNVPDHLPRLSLALTRSTPVADPEVGLEREEFWDKAYRVKKSADGRSCYPSFLRPLVAEILACGKALVLLRSQPGHRCPSAMVDFWLGVQPDRQNSV